MVTIIAWNHSPTCLCQQAVQPQEADAFLIGLARQGAIEFTLMSDDGAMQHVGISEVNRLHRKKG